MGKAPEVTVWKDDDPSRNRDIWAPEFHRLRDERGMRWYLYFTASDGTEPGHRMYVAESERDDIRGPYRFKAKLRTDPKDAFYAIDMTVLRTRRGLYAIWCGRPSEAGQGLYISRMANPWTLTGERTYLDVAGFGCRYVREGPETLQRKGKVYLVYSVCGADTPDYKLGLTVADEGAKLTDASVWRQRPEPVFARNDVAGVYGPGHNFFFKSPDGKEDWIVYHAKPGTATGYGDRSTRAQRFTWGRNGDPVFDAPVAAGVPLAVPSGEKRGGTDKTLRTFAP